MLLFYNDSNHSLNWHLDRPVILKEIENKEFEPRRIAFRSRQFGELKSVNFTHDRVAKVCSLRNRFTAMMPRIQIQNDRLIKKKIQKLIRRTNGQSLHNATWFNLEMHDKNCKPLNECEKWIETSEKPRMTHQVPCAQFYPKIHGKYFIVEWTVRIKISNTFQELWNNVGRNCELKMAKNWSVGREEPEKFRLKSTSDIKLS